MCYPNGNQLMDAEEEETMRVVIISEKAFL